MVKLIKINNGSQTDGRITANFDNLEINPNSQVALLNTSIKVYEKYIDVHAGNNKISYTLLDKGPNIELYLIDGQYDLESFRAMLQTVLNSGLVYVDASIDVATVSDLTPNGFQWKVSLGSADNLSISFNRVERYFLPVTGALNTLNVIDSATKIPNTGTSNIDYKIYRNDKADGWDNSIQSNKFFTDGCGALQFTTIVQTTQFACGLISEIKQDSIIEPNGLVYGFYMNEAVANGGTVKIKFLNNFGTNQIVDTGVKAVADYVWRIRISGGKMIFDYHDTTQWIQPLVEIDWKYDNKHYTPALSIYTKNTTGNTGVIANFVAYSDPYDYITDLYREYIEQPTGRYEIHNGLLAPQPTKISLNFNGHQELYGFYAPMLANNSTSFTWIGNSKLSVNSLPNNLTIMLRNLQLESYDSHTGNREDILMSIPTIEFLNNRVSFNMANPVFIDINNLEAMNLTQLNIELKDYTGKYIEVEEDDFDLTLLIRDGLKY